MYLAIDAVDVNYEPLTDHNLWWMLFFILFMIMNSFFLINLFVCVIVGQFNTEKERISKNYLLSDT